MSANRSQRGTLRSQGRPTCSSLSHSCSPSCRPDTVSAGSCTLPASARPILTASPVSAATAAAALGDVSSVRHPSRAALAHALRWSSGETEAHALAMGTMA